MTDKKSRGAMDFTRVNDIRMVNDVQENNKNYA